MIEQARQINNLQGLNQNEPVLRKEALANLASELDPKIGWTKLDKIADYLIKTGFIQVKSIAAKGPKPLHGLINEDLAKIRAFYKRIDGLNLNGRRKNEVFKETTEKLIEEGILTQHAGDNR